MFLYFCQIDSVLSGLFFLPDAPSVADEDEGEEDFFAGGIGPTELEEDVGQIGGDESFSPAVTQNPFAISSISNGRLYSGNRCSEGKYFFVKTANLASLGNAVTLVLDNGEESFSKTFARNISATSGQAINLDYAI